MPSARNVANDTNTTGVGGPHHPVCNSRTTQKNKDYLPLLRGVFKSPRSNRPDPALGHIQAALSTSDSKQQQQQYSGIYETIGRL